MLIFKNYVLLMIILREIRKQKKAASLVKSQKYGVLMSGQTESTINKTNRILHLIYENWVLIIDSFG
jgi:hypothetical protein